MAVTPTFEFSVEGDIGDRLLVGTASPGMASLVAVDHLVTETDAEQLGHASVENLPAIVPFSDGVPRRPTRVYGSDGGPALVVSERFLPQAIGDRFADAVADLATEHDIEEVTVLYGVPYPHGPDEHAVFTVATDGFPTKALKSAGVDPLNGGFLDGVAGTLLEAGLASGDPAVGVLVTPAHPPGPDFDAGIRLLDAIGHYTGSAVDTAPLEERSEEIRRYYEELASRIETAEADRDAIEDRMYM